MPEEAVMTENPRQVLRAAVDKALEWNAPTARDVLELFIRMECAREGLPAPRFGSLDKEAVKEAIFG